jgi:hypothetical protein
MSSRLLLSTLGLAALAFACAVPGCASRQGTVQPAAAPETTCTAPTLLFSDSYLPVEVLPTPDGRSLLVVDHGFLALRDPATLAVQRFLLPQVDGWQSATFSPDGKSLQAHTFDGQRYTFDTTSWTAQRLDDGSQPSDDAADAGGQWLAKTLMGAVNPRSSSLTALDLLVAVEERELHQLSTLLDSLEPTAAFLDPARRELLVAGEDGSLVLLDVAGQRVRKRLPCDGCPATLALQGTPEGFLSVTEAGVLRLLNRELKTLREWPSFLPTESPRVEGIPEGFRLPVRPRIVRRLQPLGGSRLAWVTYDFELGVFDLERGTHLARQRGTGGAGVRGGALLDSRRVALVSSEGELRIHDMPGQRVLVEKPGPYTGAARLDAGRLLVAGEDGFIEELATDSGEVRQRFCALHVPCAGKDTGRQERAHQVKLLVSPDRSTLVALEEPYREMSGAPMSPGSLGVWRLPGLEKLGVRPLPSEGMAGEVHFGPGGGLYSGIEPLSAPGLPTGTPIKAPQGSTWVELKERYARLYTGGGLTVRVVPNASAQGASADRVELLGADGKPRGLLADASAFAPLGRVGAVRYATFADVLPTGEHFLLASQEHEPRGPLPVSDPGGPTQVWCLPKAADTFFPRFPLPVRDRPPTPP